MLLFAHSDVQEQHFIYLLRVCHSHHFKLLVISWNTVRHVYGRHL